MLELRKTEIPSLNAKIPKILLPTTHSLMEKGQIELKHCAYHCMKHSLFELTLKL